MCDVPWQVLATHNYDGQDEDELSFEKGQIILVIPFEDPEDQVICCVYHIIFHRNFSL